MKTNQTFPKVCPRKFPFKAVCGHSIAAMYRVQDKGYDVFRLPYKDDKGRRQFHRFANYEDARAKGNEMLDQMKRGNAAALTLTNTDKVIYTRAVESLRPLNIKLDTAVLQYVEAVKALNGVDVSIAEAARSYAKRYPAKMPAKMVLDVVKEFVEAKEASKRSVRYIDDLKYRLGYPQDGTRKRKRGSVDLRMPFR